MWAEPKGGECEWAVSRGGVRRCGRGAGQRGAAGRSNPVTKPPGGGGVSAADLGPAFDRAAAPVSLYLSPPAKSGIRRTQAHADVSSCRRCAFVCVCTSCLKKEEKRAKLAEAAERRQKEAASRGILNVRSVEEKRKKKEKIEKEMATSGPPPEGGLRWTVS
ncbi:PREDICTED: small VCP/p97-interacting protein [Bison bison bison]|uniref:Small VCP/p97-interacting protein n=1 Tax=Bison bison bison TaxID=43346 RepID=A0A6P3IR30_BISBB|nr:PREDICTED: small VCP/p97-interacting protein [Bison bison bison]